MTKKQEFIKIAIKCVKHVLKYHILKLIWDVYLVMKNMEIIWNMALINVMKKIVIIYIIEIKIQI